MHAITQSLERNKKQLYLSLTATFIWGLFAHGYAFANNHATHDSLREFHSEILGNEIKMGSGRVLTPIYRELLGSDVTLPWLAGLLSLLWIGLAVFFIIRLFHVESPVAVCLIAGVCTTNIAVSSTIATYIHDLDSYMFSMLCAVVSVYIWRNHAFGWLIGAVFAAISLGIYQSFIFVAVTLAMMVCIFDLLNEKTFKIVFADGMKAIGMLILGGLLYSLMMKILLSLAGLKLVGGEYNSLDRALSLSLENIVPQILSAYNDCFVRLIDSYSAYPSILVRGGTVLLLISSLCAVAVGLLNRKVHPAEKALCVLLMVLMPLGMNMIHVLTVGKNHDLMTYPIWLFYILALLLADWLLRKWENSNKMAWLVTGQRMLCMALVFVLVYGNVRFANGMYMKKGLEHEAYMSLMTRIVARMETIEDYIPGETEVVFVDLPDYLNEVMPGFKDYWNVTGMTKSDMIYVGARDRYQAYFDYMMGLPILLADENTWNASDHMEAVQRMPVYPANGSMQMIDGVLFVKLGS